MRAFPPQKKEKEKEKRNWNVSANSAWTRAT